MTKESEIKVIICSDVIPGRYVIIDAKDGQTIDDAQGWGFRT